MVKFSEVKKLLRVRSMSLNYSFFCYSGLPPDIFLKLFGDYCISNAVSLPLLENANDIF